MLKEITSDAATADARLRRWFSDTESDLVVWVDRKGCIEGFQLCYGKDGDERALTWKPDAGFTHDHVDDGEGRPFQFKSSPVLYPDGEFDADAVLEDFLARCGDVDRELVSFIVGKLRGDQD